MLGKLLKYELSATARFMLPAYAALLIMTLVSKITTSFTSEATGVLLTQGISMMLYGCVVVAVVGLAGFMTIFRFYKNLMTDEGYLMFTLPVKPWQHIVSKLLISLLWLVISGIIVIISFFLLALTGPEMMEFFNEVHLLLAELNFNVGGMMFLFILSVLIGVIAGILQVYVSIALGQLWNDHKIVGSIVAYLVIQTAFQILGTIVMMAAFGMFGDAWQAVMNTNPMLFVQNMVIAGNVINILLGIAFFVGTNWLLTKKLNLE